METQSWVGGRLGTKEFNFLCHSGSGKDPAVLKEVREIKSAGFGGRIRYDGRGIGKMIAGFLVWKLTPWQRR